MTAHQKKSLTLIAGIGFFYHVRFLSNMVKLEIEASLMLKIENHQLSFVMTEIKEIFATLFNSTFIQHDHSRSTK